MDMVMELNHNTEYAIMNSNDWENKPPNVVFVKLEAPEADDAQLKLLVHEVHTVKRENVSNEDKFESTSLKADPHVFSNQSLKLKLETPPQDCWLGSDQKISVKQELFDEELEIKSEDEIIQENHVDDIKHPSGIKPFKCNICDKHFRLKDLLKRHLRTHTSQKPFKCNMCEYSCGRKATLKIHLMTHTGEKPFKCQICDYSCGQSANLRSHLRTHTGEKPFKCTVCGYRCRQNSTLKIHLRTHTGERPIKCSVCDYSCVHNFALKRHLRTHTGEKPYKCTVCDYSAAQSGDMKRHLITHTGVKTFKCNICEYRCARKSNLRIHLQHSHKS